VHHRLPRGLGDQTRVFGGPRCRLGGASLCTARTVSSPRTQARVRTFGHSGASTEHEYVCLWDGDFLTPIVGVVVVWEGACSPLFSLRGARRGPVT
jgi:hypothetical protein